MHNALIRPMHAYHVASLELTVANCGGDFFTLLWRKDLFNNCFICHQSLLEKKYQHQKPIILRFYAMVYSSWGTIHDSSKYDVIVWLSGLTGLMLGYHIASVVAQYKVVSGCQLKIMNFGCSQNANLSLISPKVGEGDAQLQRWPCMRYQPSSIERSEISYQSLSKQSNPIIKSLTCFPRSRNWFIFKNRLADALTYPCPSKSCLSKDASETGGDTLASFQCIAHLLYSYLARSPSCRIVIVASTYLVNSQQSRPQDEANRRCLWTMKVA